MDVQKSYNPKSFRTHEQQTKQQELTSKSWNKAYEKAPNVKDILAMLFSSAMIASSVESSLAFKATGWKKTSGSSSTKLCRRWFWKRPGPFGIRPYARSDHVLFFRAGSEGVSFWKLFFFSLAYFPMRSLIRIWRKMRWSKNMNCLAPEISNRLYTSIQCPSKAKLVTTWETYFFLWVPENYLHKKAYMAWVHPPPTYRQ